MRRPATVLALVLALTACSGGDETGAGPSTPAPSSPSTSPPSRPSEPTPSPSELPVEPPPLAVGDARAATAVGTVRFLADEVGPRPGHTPAYRRAADWVQQRFEALGWDVEQQPFPTPAGSYEGVTLDAGPSTNVVATRRDLVEGEPWLLVGAHLDTVPQGPGAEDNASGVGVVLALAEALAGRRSRLPVVLVAFGSEEPRGPSDDEHHYGSRAYVATLSPAQRRSLRAMVSLDRVGVGTTVPVGTPAEPNALTDELQAAARRAGVPTAIDPFQRSSDHWSFVRDGLPGARIGSTPYAGYHGPGDVPAVVERDQLERVARLMTAWLAPRR